MTPKQFDQWWESVLKEIISTVQPAIDKAYTAAGKEYIAQATQKMQDMFTESVDDFYDDYTPNRYRRNRSLYNLLEVRKDTDGLGMQYEFVPERMTPFRSGYNGADGLYDLVFIRGWHGGAARGPLHPNERPDPSPPKLSGLGVRGYHDGISDMNFHIYYAGNVGAPYWRVPHPYYRRWAKRPAANSTPSPYVAFRSRLATYNAREAQKDWNAILNKHISNIDL